MRKILLLLLVIVGMAPMCHAQGIPFAVNPPAPNAQMYICNVPATGNPCTNQATAYTTVALSTSISQPIQIGATGVITVFLSAGIYDVQITGRTDVIVNYGGGTAGSGAPSGACTSGSLYTDTSTGNLYSCKNGAWILGGAGGPLPAGTTVSGPNLSLPGTLNMPSGQAIVWNGDTGLSRGAAGAIYAGNGTAGDFSGQLIGSLMQATTFQTSGGAFSISSNRIGAYNGLATAGNGVSAVVAATSQKSETAADANVLTFTPPASTGSYRIRFVMSVSAASAATLGWAATWKDSSGNAQASTNLALSQSGVAAPALTFTTSAAGDYYGYIDIDTDNSATAIAIKLTFSGTSFAAKVSAMIERIQ